MIPNRPPTCFSVCQKAIFSKITFNRYGFSSSGVLKKASQSHPTPHPRICCCIWHELLTARVRSNGQQRSPDVDQSQGRPELEQDGTAGNTLTAGRPLKVTPAFCCGMALPFT